MTVVSGHVRVVAKYTPFLLRKHIAPQQNGHIPEGNQAQPSLRCRRRCRGIVFAASKYALKYSLTAALQTKIYRAQYHDDSVYYRVRRDMRALFSCIALHRRLVITKSLFPPFFFFSPRFTRRKIRLENPAMNSLRRSRKERCNIGPIQKRN